MLAQAGQQTSTSLPLIQVQAPSTVQCSVQEKQHCKGRVSWHRKTNRSPLFDVARPPTQHEGMSAKLGKPHNAAPRFALAWSLLDGFGECRWAEAIASKDRFITLGQALPQYQPRLRITSLLQPGPHEKTSFEASRACSDYDTRKTTM
jgi:hypothetical protein